MEVIVRNESTVIVSERDVRIVLDYSNGISWNEIAAKEGLSVRTIEAIFNKLRLRFLCKTTVQLVAEFLRKGLIK